MRILVLAAHPDDEVLGMGGTIKKMTQKGHTVKIVILATGIEARRSTNFKNISEYTISDKDSKIMKKQIEEIRQHAKKAANVLGTKKIQFLEPILTVSSAKKFLKYFRQSLVLELLWENSIDYEIKDKNFNNLEKISRLTLFRKFFSKLFRNIIR